VGGFIAETWLVRSVWGTNGDAYVLAVVPSVAREEDGANAVFSQAGEVLWEACVSWLGVHVWSL